MTNIHEDFKPRYELPTNRAAIDDRMGRQLAFESTRRRSSPRECGLDEEPDATAQQPESNPRRIPVKKALVIGVAVAAMAGLSKLGERAYDYEQAKHQPPVPVETSGSK